MKIAIKIWTILIITINLILASVGSTFAAGSSYSPYSPHTPTDTSLGGLQDMMILGGVGLYLLGLALIYSSAKVKSMLNSAK